MSNLGPKVPSCPPPAKKLANNDTEISRITNELERLKNRLKQLEIENINLKNTVSTASNSDELSDSDDDDDDDGCSMPPPPPPGGMPDMGRMKRLTIIANRNDDDFDFLSEIQKFRKSLALHKVQTKEYDGKNEEVSEGNDFLSELKKFRKSTRLKKFSKLDFSKKKEKNVDNTSSTGIFSELSMILRDIRKKRVDKMKKSGMLPPKPKVPKGRRGKKSSASPSVPKNRTKLLSDIRTKPELKKTQNPEIKMLIKKFKMKKHPESGYYIETFRDKNKIKSPYSNNEDRNVSSLIYSLLVEPFVFHRVKSIETIHFYEGEDIIVYQLINKKMKKQQMGKMSKCYHLVIPSNTWFAIETVSRRFNLKGYALIGASVCPAFDINDYENAKRIDLLKEYPKYKKEILRLTKE